MATKTDQKTLDLIREVNRQKAEISKIEKPNWKTNCSFSYTEGRTNDAIMLHTVADVKALVMIAGFLQLQKAAYVKAAESMEVDAPQFAWAGFDVDDWTDDIKMRINKIQIATKKKKLETLETRLNAVISPELRAKMELEAIASELG